MLTFDMRDFDRAAKNFSAALDQVPFALAMAMNDGVEFARTELITKTWPSSIQVRNQSFIKAALTTRGNRATKHNLRVAIDDRLGRASLPLHAEGGEKRPKGQALAIPTKAIAGRRGASGVPKNLRPRNVPNSFRKGDVLFQRTGAYHKSGTRGAKKAGAPAGKGYDGRGRRIVYVLAPTVEVRSDVPFERDFERAMWLGLSRAFGPRLRQAMATRR